MATTVLDLHEIDSISSEDLLHIIDVTRSNEDSKVDISTLTTYLNTALDIPQTIASVNGLQAALDDKSDKGHLHTIQQIIGLSSALDDKTDVSQAQIIGRDIILNGRSINVPSAIAGTVDPRIPNPVIVGDYLQFDTTGGGIAAITDNVLKNNLQIDALDNTSDANKPVSIATQTALDEKNSVNAFTEGQASQDVVIAANTARAAEIAINTAKNSYPTVDAIKLAGIEALADVTDTENVWSSLGISGSGSTEQYLTQRGVFTTQATATSVTKSAVDNAIGGGSEGTDYYSSNKTWLPIPTGGGAGSVTKAVVDAAIGAFPTGDSAQFYNQQGRFVDAVYDSVEDAPIIRNRTVESIVLSGTRSNVQARLTGVSEMSVITMQNTFDSSPTQYTSIFTSPNTSFTPALVLPTGSQGRQLSLTEADGTVHRFGYTTNGNYRLLAGGLTGTLRLGPVAVATTATVTAAVSVPDQTAGQTITLVGDETGTFSVGDFISPQANNFGAYRGIFIDSITFNGTNTVIVGPSNGATTFQTTSILRNAGLATEIQGIIPTFSGDPDTANTVYSSSIPATEFTTVGVNTSAHLIQVANAYAALETAITTDGIVTDNGDGTSSITVNYNTETNIDSSFTITGGLNNMESIVNVDGEIGPLSPATTITVIDPEATEVASFTSSAADTSVNNVDDIAAQIVVAVNNNTETPIDFTAEYDQATKTLILTATEAGNTNPWTIVFNNNGTTGVNAGDLGYTSSQTGEIINQTTILSTPILRGVNSELTLDVNTITGDQNWIGRNVFPGSLAERGGVTTNVILPTSLFDLDTTRIELNGSSSNTVAGVFTTAPNVSIDASVGFFANAGGNNGFGVELDKMLFNGSYNDRDFEIRGASNTVTPFTYDAGDHTLTTDATLVGFGGGGADGLSITDTVNLNLLDGTTVLSTVTLPSSSGTTIIAGTANQIINTVSGDTNTLSLAPAITDAITANTAKVGITTAQSDAITTNTAKVGITTAQATAITTNTGKTGITVAQSNAIIANTAKISNVDILPLANTFTATNTFSDTTVFSDTGVSGSIQVAQRIVHQGDEDTFISFGTNTVQIDTGNIGSMFLSTGDIAFNPGFADLDFQIRKQTTGVAFIIDAGADTMTIGSDVLTINSTTINGLPSKADALSISGQVLSLLDGTTSLSTVTLPSGGTATSVLGTSGQIGVSTVGNTATVSLDTAITGAITANTAKTGISTAQATAITNNTAKTGITAAQATAITDNTAKVSVAGLNQVGAAVLSTDSVVYYAGTALAPRRKTFSLVPLSIMNNDANFITGITKANVDTAIGSGGATTDYYASDKTWKTIPSGGTATTVLGTTGEIDVATVGNNATVSISTTITDAIDLNTAKQSVAGLTQVGGAIVASDSLLYYDNTTPRRKTFSSVPLSVFNNDSGFTTNTGTVTNVTGTANQINVVNGTTTPVVSLNNTITSAITANTNKTGITTAQASAITANTAKVSNVDILPLNNTFTGANTFSDTTIFSDTGTDGSIQVANRIVHQGDVDTFIDFQINTIGLDAGGVGSMFVSNTDVAFNPGFADLNFQIRKQTTGQALRYDAGTDTLDIGAANVTGVAGSETGTWTPSFSNTGTVGTVTGTYSRVGDTVTLTAEIEAAAGTLSVAPLTITAASLPFTVATNNINRAVGTYLNSSNTATGNTSVSGVAALTNNSIIYFLNANTSLRVTDLLGFVGFTITYQTS